MLPIILQGGFMMYPLVFLSILTFAIIFERFTAFRRAAVDSSTLQTEVVGLLGQNEMSKAMRLCATTPGPVSATLLVGLRKYERMLSLGKDKNTVDTVVTKAMSDYAPHVIEVLENRLNILSMVATIAPLLGMTGTVMGMIASFDSIAGAGQLDAAQVSSGIAEALITTATGLIVAIPAVVGYNMFNRQVERRILEIEDASTKLVDFVTLEAE